MRGPSIVTCLCLIAACRAGGISLGSREFHSEWSPGIERPWIGPEYFACRLQDWRLSDGRVECLVNDAAVPVRALHLLSADLSERKSSVTLSVRTGALDPGTPNPAALAGLLIGAGGAGIDHRLAAVVHGRPGKDGGLVCAVDGTGRVSFRDFEHREKGGGRELAASELAEIAATSRSDAAASSAGPFELVLQVEPAGRSYDLTLIARTTNGRETDRAMLAGVEARRVNGGLALVSHLGPEGSARGHWFADWSVVGQKVGLHEDRDFGPILGAQYTITRGTLRLAAQLPPLGTSDARQAELFVQGRGGRWKPLASAEVEEGTWIAAFEVEPWEARRNVPYRVVYALQGGAQPAEYAFEGVLRAEPASGKVLVAALGGIEHFSGEGGWGEEGVLFPHAGLVRSVASHDPDLVCFASGAETPEADPLAAFDAWQLWYWTFRDLVRERPSITLPTGSGSAIDRARERHLPAPFPGSSPGAYCTSLEWGGLSFAVLADERTAIENPREAGAARAPRDEQQLEFLRAWGADWKGGTWMKVALSQAPWADVDPETGAATNGDAALRELRRAFALHVCSDPRGARLVRYGIDAQHDAGYAFCVPDASSRLPAPGYGLLRFDDATRRITVECWSRSVDPRARNAKPFDGWPVTITQLANYEREPLAYLPSLSVRGMREPVVQVVEEANGEFVYTLRLQRPDETLPFRPRVFALGRYTVNVGEPGTARWRTIPHLEARVEDPGELRVDL